MGMKCFAPTSHIFCLSCQILLLDRLPSTAISTAKLTVTFLQEATLTSATDTVPLVDDKRRFAFYAIPHIAIS